MPRSWPPTEPLRFSLNSETIVILDELARTGLYGRDRGDVARTFIMEGVRQALKENPYAERPRN